MIFQRLFSIYHGSIARVSLQGWRQTLVIVGCLNELSFGSGGILEREMREVASRRTCSWMMLRSLGGGSVSSVEGSGGDGNMGRHCRLRCLAWRADGGSSWKPLRFILRVMAGTRTSRFPRSCPSVVFRA